MDTTEAANLQILDRMGAGIGLCFEASCPGEVQLLDVDDGARALATVRLDLLAALVSVGEVDGLVLAICNARRRAMA